MKTMGWFGIACMCLFASTFPGLKDFGYLSAFAGCMCFWSWMDEQ